MGRLDAASNRGVIPGNMLPRKVNVPLRTLQDVLEPRELPRKVHVVAAPSLTRPMHVECFDELAIDVNALGAEEGVKVLQH